MSAPSVVRDGYLAALLAGDGTRARHIVDAALGRGLSVADVYLDVLTPAMVEVGELWERGRLSVGYEHFATAITHGVLGALAPRMRRLPEGGRLAVLACVPGEEHALGPLMTGQFLEAAGWEVLQLGAGLPAPDLAALVAAEQPDVVGLSMASVSRLPEAREALALLEEVEPRPFIALGGRAWDEVAAAELAGLGADACVTDPRDFVALVTERFPPLPDEA